MAGKSNLLSAAGFAALLLLQPAAAQDLQMTEAELKAYDGTDESKPIYLAIDGTIFDVSSAPSFYGPGGHYHHFTGKDATRAWVTECWDTPDQLTWRMDGVESMFMNKWLDELIMSAGEGGDDDSTGGAIGIMGKETVEKMAKKATEKFGTISADEKKKRRAGDKIDAAKKVEETLTHWYKFFSENPKYIKVGSVIRDEAGTPEPPKPCEAAMKKRPIKGGLLDGTLKAGANIMGGGPMGGSKGNDGSAKAGEKMPDFMDKLNKMKKDKAEKDDEEQEAEDVEEVVLDDDADDNLVRDEL